MSINAYIKMVPGSAKEQLTIDEVKDLFTYYKSVTSKTGTQTAWEYGEKAFPYELKEPEDRKGKWFYLSSDQIRYHMIAIGVDEEKVVEEDGSEKKQSYIQITLPEASTFADKGKANEFAKFLAKKLKGELHLFNGRIMYYYPRK